MNRARQEEFIAQFGDRQVKDAIDAILRREGLSVFSDDVVREIACDMAERYLYQRRIDAQNRAIRARRVDAASQREVAIA